MRTPFTDEGDPISILWSRLQSIARQLDESLLSLKIDPDEKIILHLRRSSKLLFFTLVADFFALVPLWLPYILYAFLAEQPAFLPILGSLASLGAVMMMAVPAVTVVRWYFTVYSLTTKRTFVQSGVIAHHKLEARLDKIENVTTTTTGLINRLLKVGDVELITAGISGNLRFAKIDNPNDIVGIINGVLFEYRQERHKLQRSELRDMLGEHMTEGIPLSESLKAEPAKLPDIVWRRHPYVLLIGISVPLLAMIMPLVPALIIQRLLPDFHQSVGFIRMFSFCVAASSLWTIWHLWGTLQVTETDSSRGAPRAQRRSLLEHAGRTTRVVITISSIVLVLILAVLAVLEGVTDSAGGDFWTSTIRIGMPVAVYELFLTAWLALRVIDWRNDQYILTHDRIVDVLRVPVVYSRRNQAPLAKVQNVSAEVSLLGRILDYGDIVIETAGAGQRIVFPSIWHPIKVQETIFQYLDSRAEYEWATQQKDRQIELGEWLDVYRDLTFPPCDPPVRWASRIPGVHSGTPGVEKGKPPGHFEA